MNYAELQFAQDYPALEAARVIGSIQTQVVECSQCGKEVMIPTDSYSRSDCVHVRFGVLGSDEHTHLVFCSEDCHDEYAKDNDIGTFLCCGCYDKSFGEPARVVTLYSGAFEDNGKDGPLCDKCDENGAPEGYFWCEECGRTIAEACGHNKQFRLVNDCDMLCLRCYQEDILVNGLPRETFEAKELAGMFFSYGNPEPRDAGWTEVEGFEYYFVRGEDGVARYCAKALELMDEGYMVITGYERLSIMGDEGSVTMFCKSAG